MQALLLAEPAGERAPEAQALQELPFRNVLMGHLSPDIDDGDGDDGNGDDDDGDGDGDDDDGDGDGDDCFEAHSKSPTDPASEKGLS